MDSLKGGISSGKLTLDEDRYHLGGDGCRDRVEFGSAKNHSLPLPSIISLSQTREDTNRSMAALQRSINEVGLIHKPTIALMSEDGLDQYIRVVNSLWGSEHRLEDMPAVPEQMIAALINKYPPGDSFIMDNGRYYLVVMAGHSRIQAIRNIVAKDEDIAYVACDLHFLHSPQEILEIQIAENIHSNVSEARELLAIVEIYYYGLENNLWSSPAEFARESRDKISYKRIKSAIAFSRLPGAYRDIFRGGLLSYTIGVELAMLEEPYRDYQMRTFFKGRSKDSLTDDEEEKLKEQWILFLGTEIAHIQAKTGSEKRALVGFFKQRARGYKASWSEAQEENDALRLFEESQADLFKTYSDQARQRFMEALDGVTRVANGDLQHVLSAHKEVFCTVVADSRVIETLFNNLGTAVQSMASTFNGSNS